MQRLLIALLFAAVGFAPGFAQGSPARIGPSAVWAHGASGPEWAACGEKGASCFAGLMQRGGASPAAIAFAKALDFDGYLSQFKRLGKVDLGIVFLPPRANDNEEVVLLNGDPQIVNAWQEVKKLNDRVHRDPAFAAILRRYPNADYAMDPPARPQLRRGKASGQEFLFAVEIKDGCHACAIVGVAGVVLEFAASGRYLGPRVVGIASRQ